MLRTLRLGAVFMMGAVCMGQQGFPLKPGEWESTTSMPGMKEPMTLLFCLNDAEWIKGLSQNSTCKIDQLSVTGKGASYALDCPAKSFQMKGNVDLKFDGMEHMTGTATMTMTVNGKTTPASTVTSYRWKSSQCSDKDMNLRNKNAK